MLKPDTQHAEYAAALTRWKKCRDVIDGEDSVHGAGAAYLPKLGGQTDPQYQAYKMRTPFYNATARTVDGLVGMLFRKAPKIDAPESLSLLLDDMTLTNCDINELSEIIAREVIGVGRCGALVEYPQVAQAPLTVAQASSSNLRPYVSTYKTESVINWREERVNNVMQPVMIALAESVAVWLNAFEAESREQIRVLLLENGVYLQRVFVKTKNGAYEQLDQDVIPAMNNKPLNYIPFVFFGAAHNGASVQKPPIYDLVTLNLSHYRTTADLEHGAHYTGLPTPVITGHSLGADESLSIGSGSAWVLDNFQAKASYLEFTGQGLGALEKRLEVKEAAMAAIGARLLSPEKSAAEAAQTVQMRHAGEGAVLSSIGGMVEAGFLRILQIMADWSSIKGDIVVEFNDDFIESSLAAPEVLALVTAWQSGAISFETLFYNLRKGEMISDEQTLEIEKKDAKPQVIPAAPTAQ